MVTVEDIDAVIHRIRYGGDGLDPLILAVEYLTAAKDWKKKAELADAIIDTFNEEFSIEEVLQLYKGKNHYAKRYAQLRELVRKAQKLEAIKQILEVET